MLRVTLTFTEAEMNILIRAVDWYIAGKLKKKLKSALDKAKREEQGDGTVKTG